MKTISVTDTSKQREPGGASCIGRRLPTVDQCYQREQYDPAVELAFKSAADTTVVMRSYSTQSTTEKRTRLQLLFGNRRAVLVGIEFAQMEFHAVFGDLIAEHRTRNPHW